MGSGKSTVGSLVADALGCPFIDLDAVIEKAAGRPIADIFSADGEPAFRALEEKALKSTLAKYANATAVIALGGGTVTIPSAVKLLQEKTLCIWLQAPLEALEARVAGTARPLADAAFATRLNQREPLYAAAAEVTIDTAGLTPEEVADEIIISCL